MKTEGLREKKINFNQKCQSQQDSIVYNGKRKPSNNTNIAEDLEQPKSVWGGNAN